MSIHMIYTLADKRISRALYAEWNFYYGQVSAGLPVPEEAWYAPVIRTLGSLGLLEYNSARQMWFITTFAKEYCIFKLSNDDTVLTIHIPTED